MPRSRSSDTSCSAAGGCFFAASTPACRSIHPPNNSPRLPRRPRPDRRPEDPFTLRWPHRITLLAIVLLVGSVIGCKLGLGRELHVGMAAFVVALLLILFRVGDEQQAIRSMPWGVMIMVCGVTVL